MIFMVSNHYLVSDTGPDTVREAIRSLVVPETFFPLHVYVYWHTILND
jgi:hypothetical protein